MDYSPRYTPQSIAPILERGAAQQVPLISGNTGMTPALSALAGVANTGVDVANANQKKQSVLQAQQKASEYMAKINSGVPLTQQDHADGSAAFMSLGLSAPTYDPTGAALKKAQLDDLTVDPKLMSKPLEGLGITGNVPPTKENFNAASSLNKELVDNKQKREDALKGQKEKNDLKRTTAFGDALTNISKTRSGNAAAAQGVVLRAERLETLANAYKSGNLDKRQIEELAIGLNAMLSGSNTGSSEQVKNLVPKTMMGNMMGIGEFLSNDPKGTNQQAFVDRMMGTVQREKATASQQVKRVVMQRAVPYQDLEKTNPDQFYNTLESNGVSREEWKAWRSGGYKQMSAVQSPDNPGGNGGGNDAIDAILAKHQ